MSERTPDQAQAKNCNPAKGLLAGDIRDGDTVLVDVTDDNSGLIVSRE